MRIGLFVLLLAGGWVAWRTLPTLLQKAEPLIEVACGTSSTTLPEATFTVGCAPIAPTVDGSFDDWRSVPEHAIVTPIPEHVRVPPNGFQARWQALWDSDALFLRAMVSDSKPAAAVSKSPSQWWNGDAVSFEIGPDPRALPPNGQLREGRDFHVILALVDDGDRRAAAVVNRVGVASNGQLVFKGGPLRPGIDVVARVSDTGYELEARIPWTELGRTVPPARGEVLGMNVNVSDAKANGTLRLMISSNDKRSAAVQNLPARWQTVVLGASG